MNCKRITASLLLSALIVSSVNADERPDHFSGEASESLDQALANFTETNGRVADILAQDEISMTDMAAIHELTYTLENALERIDDEYDALEDQLEALHKASEGADSDRARALGGTYLENAKRFPGS